ncbi:MAG: primosomal protein N' [Caldisericaceae bacterium]|nr:primosomal protein N' [Caldisericaceae bacterium]
MANSRKLTLTGGVVIDGLNIKKDLFYYKIPPFLVNKIRVGSKVSVPFGPKNMKVSAFLFTLEKKSSDSDLKEVQSVISPPLFNEQTRDLIFFVSKKFFIPLHIFVNKVLKGLSPEIYRRFVICTDPEKLKNASESFTGKKKEIAEFILSRKIIPVSVVKKRFGSSAERILKLFEEEGFIDRESVSEKYSLRYVSLNIPYEKLDQVLEDFSDKKLKSSAAALLARLANSNVPLREDSLRRGIKYGKRVIEDLIKKGFLISRQVGTDAGDGNRGKMKLSMICGLPLMERSERIISLIEKNSNGKTLIIFPELSVLRRVSGIYKKRFGDKVFIWHGKNKRKLIEAIYFKEKEIFLTTPFAMFVKIPNLKNLILENASSRYFKKTDFTPFDSIVVSVKKAEMEHLHLVFSTSVPEENIFYLIENGLLTGVMCDRKRIEYPRIRIVDMRNEFKKRNYKMISLALQKEIKNALKDSKNVALLLNRKSYSTFVMCRECGYVMKCPKCGVPLYYDKEQNVLFCHICGYKEKPPDVCPRCGSINIKYFSGGIQKLEEQIRKMFPDANVVKLISEGKSESIINSSEFEKTIFVGTEYLVSHLDLSDISVFGLVSADIFLNRFSFDASVETFSVISDIATEMGRKPFYIQTYIPEHFVLNYARSFDFRRFFEQEFEMRKELKYPPFGNLIVFSFLSTDKKQAEKSAENFKKAILTVPENGKNVYGPSPSAIQRKGDYYVFEVTVKSDNISPILRSKYIKALNTLKNVKISVEPYISVRESLE